MSRREAFWSLVAKTESCWIWHGSVLRGRGRFTINGGKFQAHRIAYELTKGEIPELLRPKCSSPLCVNPEHWEKTTRASVTPKGDQHWKRTPKGRAFVMQWGQRISAEFKAGVRRVVQGPDGRLQGTRVDG